MNVIKRAKNWVFGIAAKASPTDADGNGRSDLVDRLDEAFTRLENEIGGITIEQVVELIVSVSTEPLTGQQKHSIVVSGLQSLAKDAAIWALNAAVGIAYGRMTAEQNANPKP